MTTNVGGVHIHGGTPIWLAYFMENLTKMDDEMGFSILGSPHMDTWPQHMNI